MSVCYDDSVEDINVDVCSTEDGDSRISSDTFESADLRRNCSDENEDSRGSFHCTSETSSVNSLQCSSTDVKSKIKQEQGRDPKLSGDIRARTYRSNDGDEGPSSRGKEIDIEEANTASLTEARRNVSACSAGSSNTISDSDDDEPPANRYYFESDHLALKNNKDYHLLLKTLVVLEAQRTKAVQDLQELQLWKEKALDKPIDFVKSLQGKVVPKFPQRQKIAKHPPIDFTHYLVAYSNLKLPKGAKVNTRRSLKVVEKGDDKVSESSQDPSAPDSPSSLSGPSSKIWDEVKQPTTSQFWTNEEQERLEKLLQVYPPEEIESRRWAKIADALGNRTAIQVASRVQKYFIKLAKAGLPVPGRIPSLHNIRKAKANRTNYRNSTFFPSWKPQVYMNEDDDDTASAHSSMGFGNPDDDVMDDPSVPVELHDTEEYRELLELKRIRLMKAKEKQQKVHRGFMCDLCGMEPIIGQRWHCVDCHGDSSVDLCHTCSKVKTVNIQNHTASHRLEIADEEKAFHDGDYLQFEQLHGQYNYLDPNFQPAGP